MLMSGNAQSQKGFHYVRTRQRNFVLKKTITYLAICADPTSFLNKPCLKLKTFSPMFGVQEFV